VAADILDFLPTPIQSQECVSNTGFNNHINVGEYWSVGQY